VADRPRVLDRNTQLDRAKRGGSTGIRLEQEGHGTAGEAPHRVSREVQDLAGGRALVGELRAWAKERGLKTRELLHPLRLALTGRGRGPEIAYLFAVLGARESRARIKRAREARLGA